MVLTVLLASNAEASLVYFRTMPPQGTWAEFRLEASLPSEVETWVRLTAGPRSERRGRTYQALEVRGVWDDAGKPFDFRADCEVDIEKLKDDGHPGRAVRIGSAWIDEEDRERELKPEDREFAFFKALFMNLKGSPVVKGGDAKLPGDLFSEHEFKIYEGTARTEHFGSGQAPKSAFRVWACDELPFGVGKWEMKTVIRMQETITITFSATMRAKGKTGTTTRPDDRQPKAAE